jgi:hypothetical protein
MNQRSFILATLLILALLYLYALSTASQENPQTQSQNQSQNQNPSPSAGQATTATAIRNVDFDFGNGVVVHIVRLDGKLTHKPDSMIVFDDKNSFGIGIDSAQVSISPRSLANDLNAYVFAQSGAPLKKLSASIQGADLTIKGLLASRGDVPFETTGTLTLTSDGDIRVHTTKIKALKLPVKGLMDMLGLKTAKLLSTKKVQGVSVENDDLILDPQEILPPPKMSGNLTAIAVENGKINLTFSANEKEDPAANLKNSCSARDYLQFHGGSVRFGKLEMAQTDLTLLPSEPAVPFEFAIDHYQDQLVAGFVKLTNQGGVCAHLQTFTRLSPQHPHV